MTARVDPAARDSGEPPSSFCQHCGRRSDPGAIGPIVGLCYCSSCCQYACRWCWAAVDGACPMCAVSFISAPVARAPRGRGVALPSKRVGLPVAIAAGAVLIAVSMFALGDGGRPRPTGGVEGATSVPSDVTSSGLGSPTPPAPSGSPTSCMTVPALVGMSLRDARAAWTAAGFAGSFSPGLGQDAKIVQTQSQTSGACLPATSTIVVTFS